MGGDSGSVRGMARGVSRDKLGGSARGREVCRRGGRGKARFGLTGESASGNCLLWVIKCVWGGAVAMVCVLGN